jgi:hypothetical protein
MDQSTENITAAQLAKGRSAPPMATRRWHRRRVAKAAMRAVAVVVIGIDL